MAGPHPGFLRVDFPELDFFLGGVLAGGGLLSVADGSGGGGGGEDVFSMSMYMKLAQ